MLRPDPRPSSPDATVGYGLYNRPLVLGGGTDAPSRGDRTNIGAGPALLFRLSGDCAAQQMVGANCGDGSGTTDIQCPGNVRSCPDSDQTARRTK